MTNLIRSDARRVLKDKLFLVACIIGAAFAVLMPLLYQLIFSGMEDFYDDMLSSLVSAKGQFFSAFSPGNNFGLIVPVLLAIVLCKDFSFGTVRNKIISGNRRSSIFLSLFTVCFIFLWGIILSYALVTLGMCLLFFDYQATPFEFADFLYLLESIGFALLLYLFIAAFISWLCASMKNVGLVIVVYVAVVMVMTIIAMILQISISVLEYDPGKEKTVEVLTFFLRINVFNSAASIGAGTSYAAEDVLYLTLPALIGAGGLLSLGLLKFKRKDLK